MSRDSLKAIKRAIVEQEKHDFYSLTERQKMLTALLEKHGQILVNAALDELNQEDEEAIRRDGILGEKNLKAMRDLGLLKKERKKK